MMLKRGAQPLVSFLGRIPGTDRFSDLVRHPDNERVPGLLPFRVEANLLHFKADFILDVEPHALLRDMLIAESVDAVVPGVDRATSLQAAVGAFLDGAGPDGGSESAEGRPSH
jgi:hypothetical protein